jgi:N-acetylmuramic acid 6-phosphate etherase
LIADYIDFETEIYRQKGLITYLSDEFLLDILTDTTERSPTFMLPPFKRIDKIDAPNSWAFVKNPSCLTPEAWRRCFRREPRCLAWTQEDYNAMDTGALVASGMPEISMADLMKIEIGNEVAPDRSDAVKVKVSANRDEIKIQADDRLFQIASNVVPTSLRLFEHLALKLVLNIISTGAMVKLGRVCGNWITYLDVSNKKLIDRGIRIIASQCKMEYKDACYELFKSMEELAKADTGGEKISPVQYTISKFNSK